MRNAPAWPEGKFRQISTKSLKPALEENQKCYYYVNKHKNRLFFNIMILLFTLSKAQETIAANMRNRRLATGLTQRGLAKRSGVNLATLRKFEQKGVISLESFLKLTMVLDALESVVKATEPPTLAYSSIDEVLEAERKKPSRKKGWRE